MNETPLPQKSETSMGCCIGPLAGGLGVSLLAAMLSFPPGGIVVILMAFVLGVIGAFTGGLLVIAYHVASTSGRFQLSLATCFFMMLILGLLLLGDLHAYTPHSYGWPIPSIGYFQSEWDWNPRFLIFDACVHVAVLSVGLIVLARVSPAKSR